MENHSALTKLHLMQTERAMKVIQTNPIWVNYIRNFDETNGFLFSKNPLLEEIEAALLKVDDNHTGSSFAATLRRCQYLFSRETHY